MPKRSPQERAEFLQNQSNYRRITASSVIDGYPPRCDYKDDTVSSCDGKSFRFPTGVGNNVKLAKMVWYTADGSSQEMLSLLLPWMDRDQIQTHCSDLQAWEAEWARVGESHCLDHRGAPATAQPSQHATTACQTKERVAELPGVPRNGANEPCCSTTCAMIDHIQKAHRKYNVGSQASKKSEPFASCVWKFHPMEDTGRFSFVCKTASVEGSVKKQGTPKATFKTKRYALLFKNDEGQDVVVREEDRAESLTPTQAFNTLRNLIKSECSATASGSTSEAESGESLMIGALKAMGSALRDEAPLWKDLKLDKSSSW